MKYIIFVILILFSILIFSQNINNYEYYPLNKDKLTIDLIGNLNNFTYDVTVENNSIVIKKIIADSSIIYSRNLDVLNIKDKNLSEISQLLTTYYRTHLSIDTVVVSLKRASNEQNIYINVFDRTYISIFSIGKSLSYYLGEIRYNIPRTFDYSNFVYYVKHKNSNSFKQCSDLNTIILPGDEIYLKPDYVIVIGEVRGTSKILYNPNYSLYDYIANSRGIANNGSIKNITLYNKNLMKKHKNDPIEPGDIIVVGKRFLAIARDVTALTALLSGITYVVYLIYNIIY